MAHFLNLWGKKSFSKKLGCQAQLHVGFQHHTKIQRNLIIQFKKTPRKMAGGKDGQTLFHRILLATARGLTSTTAVDWHLKECNVCLTKIIPLQSAHKKSAQFRLIQQILGSHKQMVMPIFNHTYQKISKITFSFPELTSACKKSVHSINSFLRYSQFQSPVTQLATPISDHAHPKMF